MLNGKFTSVKDIIWKIYKDSGIQDEIPFSDCIEWTIDCLELIYHPDQFERKVIGHGSDDSFDVTNYRVKIPCDLVHLVSVSVDGYPALPSTNSFHQLMGGECCEVNEFQADLLASNGIFVDGFGNTFDSSLGLSTNSAPVTYELNNNWLTLSVKTGKVCIAYLAHPTDCDGFPMIPDDVSYREAISRCVLTRLDYIKWRQNPSDQGLRNLYEHSEGQYNWYLAQAQNKAKLPDQNKMESIKRQMLRLKPSVNEWARNFTTLGVSELRKLK